MKFEAHVEYIQSMTISKTTRNYGVTILLLAGIACIYWNVINFDFINLDDGRYVFENPHVYSGLNSANIRWAFKFPNDTYWHPLAWLFHMLNCTLFGLNPGPHHIVNVILHAVNSFLLLVFFNRYTENFLKSALVASFFAFHPLNIESVAWIAELKNLLSTLFFFLTIIAYASYIENKSFFAYGNCLAMFVLGLMAKPMLVVVPVILFLLDYWPLHRFRNYSFAEDKVIGTSWKQRINSSQLILLDKIPFILISFVFCVLTLLSSSQGNVDISFDRVSFATRILNSVIWYLGYIGKIFWPQNLTVFEPYPKYVVSYWASIGVVSWLFCISFIFLRLRNKYPYLYTGWFWYIFSLIPVVGLMQQGLWAAMADRFTYLPQIGIFVLLVWGLPELFIKLRFSVFPLKAAAIMTLLLLICASWVQLQYWKDSISLFERSIQITPQSAELHTFLGYSLERKGEIEEARSQYLEALRIDPNYPYTNYYLGYISAKESRWNEAIGYFEHTLKYLDYDRAHYYLGVVLLKVERPEEAAYHFLECLRLNPEHAKAKKRLAFAQKLISSD